MKQITIKVKVKDADYKNYEKCLDDFLNNLEECFIYNSTVYEKDIDE